MGANGLFTLLAASAFALGSLVGCSNVLGSEEGSCGGGGGGVTSVKSGRYEGVAPSAPGKTLDVDRAAGVVTRSYIKDGKNVVETWAIK